MDAEKKASKPLEPPLSRLIMSPKAVVIKSNKLVDARQRLSIQEQRLILLLISRIRPDDVNFVWYKLSILDLARFLGLEKSKRIYIDVRKAVRKLMKRVITIDRNARDIDLHWIEAAEYGDKGNVKICINQVLKPYLLNLKSQFTKYNIGYIVQLRSTYSIRIYELLKRFEYLGERTFSLDKLKYILGLNQNEYKFYNHFKCKVILVAQKELSEKTDLAFDFEEIKDGKKVSEIRFIIKKNEPEQRHLVFPEPPILVCEEPIKPQRHRTQEKLPPGETAPSPPLPQDNGATADHLTRLVAMLPEKLRRMKSLEALLTKELQRYGFDFVARNIACTNARSNASKPGSNPMKKANYSAYLAKALAGDFGLSYQENEKLKAEEMTAAEKCRQEKEEKKRLEAVRLAREAEDRAKAEAILLALSESDLATLRAEAEERIPSNLRGKYSAMLVKLEMQKIVLERLTPRPPTQDTSSE